MREDHKKWIDEADYKSLLQHWRFAFLGDLMLQGDTGEYYKKIMLEKELLLTPAEKVRISKEIGW